MDRVDIVIVNWNTGDALRTLIPQCLDLKLVDKIIIVDNNSDCDDLAEIEDIKDQRLIIVYNSENLGFGAACNIGALYTESPYILFLNPDVEIKSKNLISDSIKIINERNLDVLGVKQVDNSGSIQRSCANFPSLRTLINESTGLNKLSSRLFPGYLLSDWDHQSDREVDHVIGSFYLINRDKFIKCGLFDEKFYIYYEDLDLSKKIKDAGGKIYYTSEIHILHEGGGASKSVKASRTFYSLRSRIIYAYKHLGNMKGSIYFISAMTLERLARTIFFKIKTDPKAVSETNEAYYMYFEYFKNNLKK